MGTEQLRYTAGFRLLTNIFPSWVKTAGISKKLRKLEANTTMYNLFRTTEEMNWGVYIRVFHSDKAR